MIVKNCEFQHFLNVYQARTQTFEKEDANLRVFTKGWAGANLKKILILRPKLGV